MYGGPSLSKFFFFKFYSFKINLHLKTDFELHFFIFKREFNIGIQIQFKISFHNAFSIPS